MPLDEWLDPSPINDASMKLATVSSTPVASVKRPDRIVRYKPPSQNPQSAGTQEDLLPDYLNILGMVFSMLGLMMKLKYCAWLAIYCSCISFANSRVTEDAKQVLSSFMLSVSAVVMSYLQNPSPITASWS